MEITLLWFNRTATFQKMMFHVCTFGNSDMSLSKYNESIIICSRHMCQLRMGRVDRTAFSGPRVLPALGLGDGGLWPSVTSDGVV